MVSSADGAASLDGASAGLSSDTDRRLFALLRTLSDVIMVGAATVRTESYKPARLQPAWPDLRAGRTPTPPIAVVTGRLDLDPDSPLITAAPPDARTIVITTAQAPPDRRAAIEPHADVIVAGEETVDLKAAVAALAERGHRRMLAEGGPHLLGRAARGRPAGRAVPDHRPAAGGPGAGPDRGRRRPPTRALPLDLAHVLADDGFLFCRYTRKNQIISPNERRACPSSPPSPPGRAEHQGRGSRPRSKPVATAAARSLTPSLA